MEKLFGAVAFLCFALIAHRSRLFFETESFPLFFIQLSFMTAVAFTSILALIRMTQAISVLTLKFTRGALLLFVLGLQGLGQVDARRLSLIERLQNKYSVVLLLLRRNRAQSREIESLKADVHALNSEIKTLVLHWAPHSKATVVSAHKSTSDAVPASLKNLDFVESTKTKTFSEESAEPYSEIEL